MGKSGAFINIDIESPEQTNTWNLNKSFNIEILKDESDSQNIMTSQTDQNFKIIPMYEIPDLNIKLQYNKSDYIINQSEYLDDGKIDVYSASIDTHPIGFVHYEQNTNTFILTNKTPASTQMAITNINTNKNSDNIFYNYQITEYNCGNAYTYQDLDEHNISSQSNLIKMYGPDFVFTPTKKITGIDYNYLYIINNSKLQTYGNYKHGDIYGDIRQTKNLYDPLYSMNMPNCNTITKCRSYCGIGICGNKLYLKYYDNIEYKKLNEHKSDDVTEVNMYKQDLIKYPYQKIEIIDILNNAVLNAKHKTNYFSIEIKKTGLVSNNQDTIKNKIKKDIQNQLRDLIQKVCPVDTNLVKISLLN